MTTPENDPDVTPENADVVGNQDNDSVDVVDETPDQYTEDEPYVTEAGDSYWIADGKTFRKDRTDSVFVTDGDHIDTVRALSELGY